VLLPLDHREKVIAGKLSQLAGKAGGPIGEQYLGFTITAGIKEDLSGSWMAGVIFVVNTKLEISKGNPAGLPTPTGMNNLLMVRKKLQEGSAGLGSVSL
jgi:hypothetical protein